MEISKAPSASTFHSLSFNSRPCPWLQSPISHWRSLSPSRNRVRLSEQRILCKANPRKVVLKKEKSDPDDSHNFPDSDGRTVIKIPSFLMIADKEEAKAVLTLFLGKQGLNYVETRRSVRKSEKFVDHLLWKLHSTHRKRYLVGRELSTLEIRDVLMSYLESLLKEHGDSIVDMIEQFPNPPDKKKAAEVGDASAESKKKKTRKKAVVEPSSEQGLEDHSPQVLYLRDIGFDLERVKEITRKYPSFARYSLEGKLKPVVEFLLYLGVAKEDIPVILCKRPQLCGLSLEKDLIPTMAFVEDLGVDKAHWPKVIHRCPSLLTLSKQKLEATVGYLSELGVSTEEVGKMLIKSPKIMTYSVDSKLRPIAEYFGSLGIDVATLIYHNPQVFGLSLERSLKPITKFFLDRGFTTDDIRTMVDKYGALYTLSLTGNLIPNWEFFLEMDYPESDLVTFPNFFGYGLEKRIKPRYNRAKEHGVPLVLDQLLSVSEKKFGELLKKKIGDTV